MKSLFESVGRFARFAATVILDVFRPPIEWEQLWLQIGQIGSRSLPLVTAAGLATGVVMTLHSRTSLARFGASAMVPTVQSLGFFIEIGPLLTALLVAGRVGAGIGAVLSNMRATEQIDAIEALSIDSFKFLVVPRVLACVLVVPGANPLYGFQRTSRRVFRRIRHLAYFRASLARKSVSRP